MRNYYKLMVSNHQLNFIVNALEHADAEAWLVNNFDDSQVNLEAVAPILMMADMLKPDHEPTIRPIEGANFLCPVPDDDEPQFMDLSTYHFNIVINQHQLDFLREAVAKMDIYSFYTDIAEQGKVFTSQEQDSINGLAASLALVKPVPEYNKLVSTR